MEKACDSLEHNFIYATLEKFGFEEDFIQWTRTLLCNASSCVMDNGFSTGYFNLNRGTRKGDPLSAFFLCLEVLLVRIRNDASVRGFKFDKIEIKLISFADDVTFLVKDVSTIKQILKIMKTFGAFSSLKISVEKSEACWLGKSKGNTDKPTDCKWVPLKTKAIKILGTHFSYNKELEEKMNLYNLTMDCRNVLNLWKQRWLSLAGKIQSFKSVIASKPVYIATMKVLPKNALDDLQAMHKEFIRGSKKPKIKHSALIGHYEDGGFRDVDLPAKFKSIKFIWIKTMLDKSNFHPWIAVADKIVKPLGELILFIQTCNFHLNFKAF